ncbi:ABC transporter substrate-binding protein [Sporichthya polymorpha]|uniref:ABC transporter substrate-binding protein n=1 Tax=Sporichthya polymorpha TaxID=35751 RepID=UPI00035F529B|nr:ABC transporter substrate-binding protein [Sporichthya polymorpha]
MTGRHPLRRAALAVLTAAVLVTGCGTRASEEEVRAGAGGGAVTLDSATLDQLRAATAGGNGAVPNAPAAVGRAPVSVDSGDPSAALVPGAPAAAAAPANGTRPQAGSKSSGGTAAVSSATCSGSEAPVVLGQIGSFSGVLGAIFASARTAAAIHVQHINASGGLACHPVTLYAVDDGGDPSRAASHAQALLTTRKAVALVATFAPMSMSGIVPVVERHQVPMIGGDAIDPAWFANPLLFPQGAGLDALVEGGLRQTVQSGKTKLGLLYCVEASLCTSIAKSIPDRAKAVGAEIVYSSAVSLTQTDFTAQCQNAKNAGVESFGMGVDGSAIARVARSCAALGYYPQFASGGGVISPAQSKDPGIRRNTMTTSSGNAPWMLTDTPGLKEYHAALARYAPGTEADGNSLSAWASMKLLEAAVQNLGPGAAAKPLTATDLRTGLGKVKNETLGGLAPPITFSPGQKAAPQIPCVYFELLTEKGWTAPNGSKAVCAKR